MAVTIRLMRFGKKGQPFYRIVALDKRAKRDGAYIEKIGTYDPMVQPHKIEYDKTKFEAWKAKGAELSEGVRKLQKFFK
ncbi:30S ribosomal protein S16 [Candidatus Roizmanbacteria bacterium]|nr:30S ribosomal protein S16 [Candidatus Roizmanbacteria bacterium]